MKKKIPPSNVQPGHPDFDLLSRLGAEITRLAGGADQLAIDVPEMLRECIDYLINTPRTGRRDFEELEKVEKTFIATQVEIVVREYLKLESGLLDTVILGHDVDIKFTVGSNWTIPPETLNHPCLLIAADEVTGLCYMGLFVVRSQFMHGGDGNRDEKRGITAAGFKEIYWLLLAHPYPPNFWRKLDADVVERIFAGRSGNDRIVTLFREVQKRPVSRDVIHSVARQLDFMRRSRADKGKRGLGSRERLKKEGILLLSGTKHSKLIKALNLPRCGRSDFISFTPRSAAEWRLAEQFGIPRNG
ncbi:NaeI family type II restriction endonuclease [Sphingomonas xanthus]|uniref:Type II restriction enzyme NaeI domain-containing protein n=1 Tax=Sphingomonas xanthus TaxID=2594473 RepID=A0A516IT03_9SPHN|nr:NaeI family type II restriction endonuclease [Sphingomonas xanthus]QDP20017.1 hypothetical protein FMM02_08650 [Sphingomonas xanthus]